ncbi:WD40 repeat-like protein [Epithele typhae]|uniref:WD40 repeat-like protein n=1 Tax=Epithele typhae TaxID=378194 RepID=UPI0020084949|nr:WD40 repeat-like protein [Epithele typhae]KAH9943213.1 WD40 repeat-like protein [Epithele typhae]
MSHSQATSKKEEEEEIPPPERPPSPAPHTTLAVRGLHAPNFSAFRPREFFRATTLQPMSHVAWSCDGRKLGAVGIDKIARVWQSDKSLEQRTSTNFTGGHSDDIDYIAWSPVHPELFCTSSQKDRRIVFWDGRQSRSVQSIQLKVPPAQVIYAPDGKSILYCSTTRQIGILRFGSQGEGAKDAWPQSTATTALFNFAGDALVLTQHAEQQVRIVEYPSLNNLHVMPAHVQGVTAAALDPRGRYLASGGNDSIVNLFDVSSWICARTIAVCNHGINALSFSHDGEFIAIANQGNYIDICEVETGMPLHRVPTLGPVATVTWHSSKHLIAYCGQTKPKEGNPTPVAWIGIFGPGS